MVSGQLISSVEQTVLLSLPSRELGKEEVESSQEGRGGGREGSQEAGGGGREGSHGGREEEDSGDSRGREEEECDEGERKRQGARVEYKKRHQEVSGRFLEKVERGGQEKREREGRARSESDLLQEFSR